MAPVKLVRSILVLQVARVLDSFLRKVRRCERYQKTVWWMSFWKKSPTCRKMKNIVVLGSTGSIGKNTLEVARNLKDKFRVIGLSSNSRWDLLAEQVEEFKPAYVALNDSHLGDKLRHRLSDNHLKILTGNKCLEEIVLREEVDVVVSAVVGAVGLQAAIAAVQRGKVLALANKESLVMAGHIVMPMAKK